jgi:hypothetical protein
MLVFNRVFGIDESLIGGIGVSIYMFLLKQNVNTLCLRVYWYIYLLNSFCAIMYVTTMPDQEGLPVSSRTG